MWSCLYCERTNNRKRSDTEQIDGFPCNCFTLKVPMTEKIAQHTMFPSLVFNSLLANQPSQEPVSSDAVRCNLIQREVDGLGNISIPPETLGGEPGWNEAYICPY
uniref:Uncharacterized protein n=1 Tax=Micrurus corallinus TaxID=54390 RepID=A0A2D4GGJ8_MICCO